MNVLSSFANFTTTTHNEFCRWEPVLTSTKDFVVGSYELGYQHFAELS